MADYEFGAWDPPAPIVRATVRGPQDAVAIDVPMLIDTGADISVVPQSAADAAGGVIVPSRIPVEFYTGTGESLDEANLSVEFARFRFEGLFLVADSDYGILGRNVINLMTLTLDGPNLIWSMRTA